MSNPFPGLRPFESHESHLFFGREGQTEAILDRLRRTRFVALLGPSGSGKSSLVRAGLLPTLFGDFTTTWRVVLFRPGSRPITHLAEALAQPRILFPGMPQTQQGPEDRILLEATLRRSSTGLADAWAGMVASGKADSQERLLVLVDQFEELFRFTGTDRREAADFVRLFLHAVDLAHDGGIFGMITMRSDHLGHCESFRDLPEAISRGLYLIPRMLRDQRRRAIEGPMKVSGGVLEPALVTRLLNDAGDDPDQLPVLQHALMRMWEPDRPLGLQHYERIGGLSQALDRHLEELYGNLTEPQQEAAAEIFRRLTESGGDGRGVRRPTAYGELQDLAGPETAHVLEVFRAPGCTFLMPPAPQPLESGTIVDLSHESMLRHWKRLQGWAEDETRWSRTLVRLAEDADAWSQGTHELLRDPRLATAEEWRDERPRTPRWAARYVPADSVARIETFLQASRQAQIEEAEARERERRIREEQQRQLEEQAHELAAAQVALQRTRHELEEARTSVATYRSEIEALVASGQLGHAQRKLLDLVRDFSHEPILEETLSLGHEMASYTREDLPQDRSQELLQKILVLSQQVEDAELPAVEPALVLETRDLRKRYRRGSGFELHGVDLQIRQGEITGVVGPNGAGKSTLLRILAGELAADGGHLAYPLLTPRRDWALIRNSLGYVPQTLPRWWGRLADTLHYTAAVAGLRGKRNLDEVEFYLQRLGLKQYADATWSQLSGGFKVRFALARALVSQPRLLILDEPLGPLDLLTKERFLQDLRDLSRSARNPMPILMTSQDLYEIESIADKVLFLDSGGVRYYGRTADIGRDREDHLFELECELELGPLSRILQTWEAQARLATERVALVRAPRELGPREFLSRLLQCGVHVSYFRDVSHSTRDLFDRDAEL